MNFFSKVSEDYGKIATVFRDSWIMSQIKAELCIYISFSFKSCVSVKSIGLAVISINYFYVWGSIWLRFVKGNIVWKQMTKIEKELHNTLLFS